MGRTGTLRQIPGVLETEVGYTGGATENPIYRDVKTGETGHAEALRIVFDPTVVSLQTLLVEHFFRLHDPTTLNRQGNDIGSQYRSVIFTKTEEQKKISKESISQIDDLGIWNGKVVTEILEADTFWSAEEEHQDYLQKNPGGYTCHFYRK